MLRGCGPLEAPAGAVVLMGRVPTAATSPAPAWAVKPTHVVPSGVPRAPHQGGRVGLTPVMPLGSCTYD